MSHGALWGLLLGALLLAGCGDDSRDYPALIPTDQLLAEPAIPGHAGIATGSPDQVASDLAAAGAALNVSSAQVTAEAPVDPALADRAATLRRRADTLSNTDLSCEDPLNPAGC